MEMIFRPGISYCISNATSPLIRSAFAIVSGSEGLQYLVRLHEEVGIVACMTLGGVRSMV